MNWMWLPTLLITVVFFFSAQKLAYPNQPKDIKVLLLILGLALGLPGLLYFIYYFKILGDPVWFFRLRALPGSELAAGGVGFLMGCLHGFFGQKRELRRFVSTGFFPVVMLGIIIAPYLKPVAFSSPDGMITRTNGRTAFCLQSSSSSCGAASAATLLRFLGKPADERAIAREAYTSFTGTENWYLARAFRRRGVQVEYIKESSQLPSLHYPAIAGVRLDNTGHFIVIMSKEGDNFVIGDPMIGREKLSAVDLRKRYQFTGFFMAVK